MYEAGCPESKRTKIHDFIDNNSIELLCDSFKQCLKLSGFKNGPKVIDKILESPNAATKILAQMNTRPSVPMTPDEALAFFVNHDCTKEKYIQIRKHAKRHNVNLYPAYRYISAQKQVCYPDNMEISETRCTVPLQDALNQCVKRLLVFLNISRPESVISMNLNIKYGFDGTSGNCYRQIWTEDNVGDSHIFCSSFVPLRLTNIESGDIIWENPHPSSTRLCFPLKIEFIKENTAVSQNEEKHLQSEIDKLQPYTRSNIIVNFQLSLTMIDGKVSYIKLSGFIKSIVS